MLNLTKQELDEHLNLKEGFVVRNISSEDLEVIRNMVNLHWKKHLVKIKIALGKGKKLHDKRASAKEADWQRSKDRLVKDK